MLAADLLNHSLKVNARFQIQTKQFDKFLVLSHIKFMNFVEYDVCPVRLCSLGFEGTSHFYPLLPKSVIANTVKLFSNKFEGTNHFHPLLPKSVIANV